MNLTTRCTIVFRCGVRLFMFVHRSYIGITLLLEQGYSGRVQEKVTVWHPSLKPDSVERFARAQDR
jgi:hypothetical protein